MGEERRLAPERMAGHNVVAAFPDMDRARRAIDALQAAASTADGSRSWAGRPRRPPVKWLPPSATPGWPATWGAGPASAS